MANEFWVSVNTKVDTSKAQREINTFINKDRKINLELKTDTKSLKLVDDQLRNIDNSISSIQKNINNTKANFSNLGNSNFKELSKQMEVVNTETHKYINSQNELVTRITKTTDAGQKFQTIIKQSVNDLGQLTTKTQELARINGYFQPIAKEITTIESGTTAASKAFDLLTKSEKEAAMAAQKLAEEEALLNQQLLITKAQNEVGFNSLSNSITKLGNDFATTTLKVAKFGLSTAAIGVFTGAIYSAITAVKDFDASLTEYKKVSDLSGESLDEFTQKLGDLGVTVARTRSEMIESTQEFRKSGFNDEDSARLAQISELFRNVADEEISSAESAGFIVSQMKAYGDETTAFAEHTVNAINNVSNNMAVSSADIESGLSKTAAAMATAGNTFEESVALVTSATEVMHGQANKVSRGMRTISATLAKTAESSGVLEYNVQGVTRSIDLLDNATGDLKSTFEVFQEIYNNGWNEMTNAEKEMLGLQIANKTQLEVALSSLNNFSAAEKALGLAIKDNNSAWNENTKYMESVEAKLNKIKTAWQNLVLGEGGLTKVAKVILDCTAALLEFANTDLGGLVIGIGAVTTAVLALNKALMTLTGIQVSAFFGGLLEAIKFLPTFFALCTDEAIGFAGALELLNINPIFLAITAGTAVVMGMVAAVDALTTSAEESAEKIKEYSDAINNLNEKQKSYNDELENLKNKSDLTPIEKQRIALLEKQIEETEKLIRLNYELQSQEEQKRDVPNNYSDGGRASSGVISPKSALQLDTETASVTALAEAYRVLSTFKANSLEQSLEQESKLAEVTQALTEKGLELIDTQELLQEQEADLNEYDQARLNLIEDLLGVEALESEAIDTNVASLESLYEEYGVDAVEDFLEKHEELATQLENGEATYDDLRNAIEEYRNSFQGFTDEISDLKDSLSSLESDYNSLTTAVEDFNDGGTFTQENLTNLLNLTRQYSDAVSFENGQLVVSEQAFKDVANARITDAEATLLQETRDRLAKVAKDDLAGATEGLGTAAENSKPKLESADEVIIKLGDDARISADKIRDMWSALDGSNTAGMSKAAKEVTEQIQNYFVTSMNAMEYYRESINTSYSKQAKSSAKSSKGSAKESKDAWLEAYKAEKDTIDSMYKTSVISAEEYAAKLKELSDKYLTDSKEHQEKYAKELHSIYEEMYKALQKSLKDALDEEEKRLKKSLDDIKDEKSERIKAVKRENEEALKSIKKQIDALKDEKKAVKDSYDARIDALKAERKEYERQVELMKLKQELAKAEHSFNYVMDASGHFQWLQDQEAVDKAREDELEEKKKQQYERELEALEKARDDAVALYEKRIDDLEKYYDSEKEHRDKALDALEDYFDKEINTREDAYNTFKEQANAWLNGQYQVAADENTIYGQRLANLKSFVDNYNAMLATLGNEGATASNNYSGNAGSRPKGIDTVSDKKSLTTAQKNLVANQRAKKDAALGVSRKNGNVSYQKGIAASVNRQIASGVKKRASGDSYTDDGAYIVGENPHKEIVLGSKLNNGVMMGLSKGSGIVNAKSTRTLAGLLNSLNPNGLGKAMNPNTTNNNTNNNITISNVSLPNVKDGADFINYLQNFDVDMLQRAY